MIGPGKYDSICTVARESTDAAFIAVIVIGGNQGNGFSVQATDEALTHNLPKVLRKMADDIEADFGTT